VKQQTRSRIASGLDGMRLLGPVERMREAWLAKRAGDGPPAAADGLPLPPARLRLLVDGRSGDAERFLALGAELADSVDKAVSAFGTTVGDLGAILDFGCGCGRAARNWATLEGPEIHGCDYNPELVEWCQDNLPFMRTVLNQLDPPTPYEPESFDLIYAFSVLSHLDEPLQEAWIAEFRRLLRPGGLLLVSVLGEECRGRLNEAQQERFDRGELIVERPRMEGRNLCTAYHPRPYIERHLLAGFDEVKVVDLGTGAVRALLQDSYVARAGAARAGLNARR
jgi:SAM-dependent methyltransferase